jgi:UDP-glucose 4-epimerase
MIIVTGATGFIGRRVVARLVAEYPGREVVCLVRDAETPLELSGREVLARLGVRTLKVDLAAGRGMERVPRSPDLVLSLAANTDTEESDHTCNDVGLRNLYGALAPLASGAHFLHVSTTALLAGRADAGSPFTEETPPAPSNEYGRSKLRAEEFIAARAARDRFALTVCRLTTVWGEGMRPNSFFDVLKRMVLQGSPVTRLNWPGLTDLIHVDDAAELIVALSKRPGQPGAARLYTLSTEALTLAEVNRMLHERLGVEYRPINLPAPFWKAAASSRRLVYALERLLPARLYNPLWRATLVSDNVIYADTSKIKREFPGREPKRLADFIEDVLG